MQAGAAEPVLEIVPNISVGRDLELVDELEQVTREALRAASATSVGGGRGIIADVHADADHDRTVFTLVGSAGVLLEGMSALARASVAALDLHAGHGVHPRIGVVDVVPVVALGETERDRAAAFELAEALARVLGDELLVPCVRYGIPAAGADASERIDGAGFTGAVRRGGGPAVMERVAAGELELVAGPPHLHPTAGVTMVGVREVLIAFNVDLAVDDLELARAIARDIREATGGATSLPGVRALGLRLPKREPAIVQVSTNIERHSTTGPAKVAESVFRLADARGAKVDRAELVGLAPDSALGPLRYACTRLGIPLATGAHASLDAAISAVAFQRPPRPMR